MLKFFLFGVGVILFEIFCSNLGYATVTQIYDPARCLVAFCAEISGEVTQTDLKELKKAVGSVKEKLKGSSGNAIFRLNSSGGDVEAAIGIGRLLREIKATAITWEQGRCYSACVFILAGAVQRIRANVGIHRPYSVETDKRDYQATQMYQRQLAKLAKDYLEEVNVSPSLYDAMVSIPPEKIKLLSESELDYYGLLKVDPVQQEIWDANSARQYGISMIEYIRRKAQVNITCGDEDRGFNSNAEMDLYTKCKENILSSGLP